MWTSTAIVIDAMLGHHGRVREVAGMGSGDTCFGFIVVWSRDNTRRDHPVRPEPASRRGP